MVSPALAQCRFQQTRGVPTETYRFAPEVTQGDLTLHVSLEFRMGAGGVATLVVPTAWAGETLHGVVNLRAISRGAVLTAGADAGSRVVHAQPGRRVAITYDLRKDWTGPFVNPLQFHAVLFPEFLEFTGSNALVRVKLGDRAPERVNFDWQRLPAGWALATSFGTSTAAGERCQSSTVPWRSVEGGLYAAGDFRIHRFQIGSRPAVLAIRGDWTFTDEEAITRIGKVVGMVREFWHDENFPYFLVTLKPYDQDHGSSDGSAFTNAFWMYVSRRDSLDGLLPQLAHESFHAWNPMRMGVSGSPKDYEETKWFKEGATEYYAQLLTFRAGELSQAEYVASLNKDLRSFPGSTSEYVRGRVISLWLDGTIRQESGGRHSLDDVMFAMVRTADQPYTLARLLGVAGRFLSPESRAMLRSAVMAEGNLPAPRRAPGLGECAEGSLREVATFDLGLDLAGSRAAKVLTGVVEGGPAYLAGLRDGEALKGVSVYKGEPERPAKFRVAMDGGEREIIFFPRGKPMAAWQYELVPAGACRGGR